MQVNRFNLPCLRYRCYNDNRLYCCHQNGLAHPGIPLEGGAACDRHVVAFSISKDNDDLDF